MARPLAAGPGACANPPRRAVDRTRPATLPWPGFFLLGRVPAGRGGNKTAAPDVRGFAQHALLAGPRDRPFSIGAPRPTGSSRLFTPHTGVGELAMSAFMSISCSDESAYRRCTGGRPTPFVPWGAPRPNRAEKGMGAGSGRPNPSHHRVVFPQSSSNSRVAAGCDGFLNLSQSRERPET
jgi:hypothetical protein